MTEIVFVHAIGRPGRDAWPNQGDLPNARVLTRRGFADESLPDTFTVDDEGSWIADQLVRPSVVVGHSWSGVAALASAFQGVTNLRGAVLVEPIATFAAAEVPVVRDHIKDLSPAFVPGLSAEEFRSRFSAGMGFQLPAPDSPQAVRSIELLRRHRPPWETALTRDELDSLLVPVTVVTGGWSPLYEAIAECLAEHPRVSHHLIEGAGHRPQDV